MRLRTSSTATRCKWRACAFAVVRPDSPHLHAHQTLRVNTIAYGCHADASALACLRRIAHSGNGRCHIFDNHDAMGKHTPDRLLGSGQPSITPASTESTHSPFSLDRTHTDKAGDDVELIRRELHACQKGQRMLKEKLEVAKKRKEEADAERKAAEERRLRQVGFEQRAHFARYIFD